MGPNLQTAPKKGGVKFKPVKTEEKTKPRPREMSSGNEVQLDGDSVNSFNNLIAAMEDTSPDALEAHVNTAKRILGGLLPSIEKASNIRNSAHFSQRIKELQQQPEDNKVIIIFRGKTGSGKSSTITSLCGEKRLLPTNCMRACTAVATEIAWNDSDDPTAKYRAEIEFISHKDWHEELQCLFKDLMTEDGEISNLSSDTETPGAVSWAKLSTVYPEYKKPQDLAGTTAEALAANPSIQKKLSTTIFLKAISSEKLHEQIQLYVDSKAYKPKDKIEEVGGTDGAAPSQLWPLVKAVRIYLKNDLLESGIVLVDLPGCGDSNPARTSVIQSYEERANATWIVAPISRAVNDRHAHQILSDSFRLQLRFEGMHSDITFICSSTDNLNVDEVADDCGIDIMQYHSEMARHHEELQNASSQHYHLSDMIESLTENYMTSGKQLRAWDKLSRELQHGKTVFPPQFNSRKRKSRGGQGRQLKRLQADAYELEVEKGESGSIDNDSEDNEESKVEPLTHNQIVNAQKELSETMKNLDEQIDDIKEKKESARDWEKGLRCKITQLEVNLKSQCIQARNEYARENIKKIFANIFMGQSQDAINDEDDMLPVFCISNNAFQAIRINKAKVEFPGFQNLDQTEIPKLRAHAIRLAELGRVTHCRKSLNGALQLLQSIGIWTAEPRQGRSHTEAYLKNIIETKISYLRVDLEEATNSGYNHVRTIFQRLTRELEECITNATDLAPEVAAKWGASKIEGGYTWNTYGAIISRGSKAGNIDFNEDLATILKKHFIRYWERAFLRIRERIKKVTIDSERALTKFHDDLQEHFHDDVSPIERKVLNSQLQIHVRNLKSTATMSRKLLRVFQQKLHGRIKQCVEDAMKQGYALGCKARGGKGHFKNMKNAVETHIQNRSRWLFQGFLKEVEESAADHPVLFKEQWNEAFGQIIVSMSADYKHTFLSSSLADTQEESRREIAQMLLRVDNEFKPGPTRSVDEAGAH